MESKEQSKSDSREKTTEVKEETKVGPNTQDKDQDQEARQRKSSDKDEYGELAYSSQAQDKNVLLSSTHKLNSSWCFWYASRKIKDHKTPYLERLKKFAEFNSVEDFFKYYMYMKSASEIDRNTDISLFKKDYQPLWESCPEGGCWFVRFKKNDDPVELDLKWEKLLFSLIGEQFDEPSILGTTLSIRGRETIIELWFNYQKNEKTKASIGQKIKEIIHLDKQIMLYFKDNSLSLQDKSTLKNAETYNFAKRKNTYF